MSPSKLNEDNNPEWLEGSFYKEIFEKQRSDLQGKPFELKVIDSGSVVDVGENFCSQMFRVKVQCNWDDKQDVTSFIVKSCQNNLEFLKEQNVFGTEFDMYRHTVQAFEQMWMDIGAPVAFGPKCLKIVDGETQILVLSDLKEEGFGMLDRHLGMDETATLLVLDKIAKFHASSLAYKERIGEFCPTISRKILKSTGNMWEYCLEKIKLLSKAARHFDVEKGIPKAIEKWANGFQKDLCDSMDPDSAPNDFQVLCHGDLWLNNMMFRTDSTTEKVTDAILIDFQLSYWNRPEADLYYFLCSSVVTDVLVKRFDFFLRFYHEKLIEAMQQLKVQQKPPSLRDFHLQVLRNNHHIVRVFTGVLPVILMNKSDAIDLKELMSKEKSPETTLKLERAMFYNPGMEQKVKLLLPFFYDRGLLDTNNGNSSVEGINGHQL